MWNLSLLSLRAVFLLVAGALICPPLRADTIEGHVLDANGIPLRGVDLDVYDQITGVKLVTPNDDSGTGGSFALDVPPGLYRVGFDPFGLPGPTLAPKEIRDVLVAGTVDLGDVRLSLGAILSGRVVDGSGAGLFDVDLDLVESPSGRTVYTPHDDTDAAGNFAFAVELGTYEVVIEPEVSTRLLVHRTAPLALQANTALGTIALAPGFWLSGTVTAPGGAPLAGIDIDAFLANTTQEIPLAAVATDANGRYRVVVPGGALDALFTPAQVGVLLPRTIEDLAVANDVVLDVELAIGGEDPHPTPVGIGDTFVGALLQSGEVDAATFFGLEGFALSIDLRYDVREAAVDCSLAAPSGAPVSMVAQRREKPGALSFRSVPLTEVGVYTLRLFSRVGASSGYVLRTKVKVAKSLRAGSTERTIATPGGSTAIEFDALAGSLWSASIALLAGASDLGAIELLAPSGGAIALGEHLVRLPGRGAAISALTLPASGRYTLRLALPSGESGTLACSWKQKLPPFSRLVVTED